MGHLRSLRRPTLTWSNLTLIFMTYHDNGHPIKTNPYKLAKIKILALNFQDMTTWVT